jgi:hypothetical protein
MLQSIVIVAAVPGLLLSPQPSPEGRLTFTAPAEWTSRQPQSSMRVAEYQLPPTQGDREPAELVIYYFGGSGGSVEANVQRWLGQMQQPDGRESSTVATRESRTVNELAVSLLDLSGTYVAEARPGSIEHYNKPSFRMRTAVIQTPRGPYYVKLVGPEKTVARWNDAFATFIGSVRYEK